MRQTVAQEKGTKTKEGETKKQLVLKQRSRDRRQKEETRMWSRKERKKKGMNGQTNAQIKEIKKQR